MTAPEIDATIYALYPRKVGRVAAMKAIAKAVKVVQKESTCDPLEARRILYRATQAYARSPAGNNPDRTLIPHPATWFNRGSYLDDPREWGLGGNNGNRNHEPFKGKTAQHLDAGRRAAEIVRERGEAERAAILARNSGSEAAGEVGSGRLLGDG